MLWCLTGESRSLGLVLLAVTVVSVLFFLFFFVEMRDEREEEGEIYVSMETISLSVRDDGRKKQKTGRDESVAKGSESRKGERGKSERR